MKMDEKQLKQLGYKDFDDYFQKTLNCSHPNDSVKIPVKD
jgi:hypothetical protein